MKNCNCIIKNKIVRPIIIFLGCFMLPVLINLSCAEPRNGEGNNNEKITKINELISLYADYEGFNGSVLVAHEGKVTYRDDICRI